MIRKILSAVSEAVAGGKYSGLIVGCISFLLVFAAGHSEIYKRFNLNLYDIAFTFKPSVQEWDRLSFIDIDDNSTDTLGQFPWPRHVYGYGLDVMKQAGVDLAVLDIMFPNRSPLHVVPEKADVLKKKAVKRQPISPEELQEAVIDNDLEFASSVSAMGRVVISYNLSPEPAVHDVVEFQKTAAFQKARRRFEERASIAVSPEMKSRFAGLEDDKTKSLSYPIPELMESAKLFGFVNRDTDIDGAVRKVRLVQMFNDRLYFNLALVMLMNICGIDAASVNIHPGDGIILEGGFNPVTGKAGNIKIPVDEKGMMYVNWAGEGKREETFNILSYYSLMEYDQFSDSVHDYLDGQAGPAAAVKLSAINKSIEQGLKGFRKAVSGPEKEKLWKQVEALRMEKAEIKNQLVKPLQEEIASIEGMLRGKEDAETRKYLEELKNDEKAVKMVMSVDNLSGHTAITGLTATGTIDIGQTPLSNEYAMVGAYHNTVNTVLQGAYIGIADRMFNLVLMFALALAIGIAVHKMNARYGILTVAVSFIAANICAIGTFSLFNFWIDQLGVSLSLLLPSVSIVSLKFMKEENQKKFIKGAFSRYLAPSIIDQIIANPKSLELGGEEREITIFFSDVAKFSTISEKLTPPELVKLLNEYLSAMTEIILAHGGTVDKYEGDAVMAFFGAPLYQEDHAVRACLAAIDQNRRLKELQEHWRDTGQDQLSVRMGMNTGKAVVGNMGSASKMDYTAMGDSVNLASRLEGANKYYGSHSMISEATYEAASDFIDVRKLDIIRVVGKEQPITIYELLGRKGTLPGYMYEMMERYNRGIEQFSNRQWKRAKQYFNEALEVVPDDGPSQTYVQRCEEFAKKPPSKNWDGVYRMKSK